jgi:hypothetical protein
MSNPTCSAKVCSFATDTVLAVNGRTKGERIGLLAGSGRFPMHFARAARDAGMKVVCLGIRYEADPALAGLVDRFHWVSLARLSTMIRKFRREGVRRAVMAGKVRKQRIYTPFRLWHFLPDLRTVRVFLFGKRRDNRDDSLLLNVIAEFSREGIEFESALCFCPELLVKAGCPTRRRPSPAELKDVAFGWHMAKEMGRLDVGQTVAVRERATLAVEAIEGTDRAILRAGELCPSGGFTVVKVAKPQQDMRFDVPTIGVDTIETLHKAGARVLAIEAGKTILLDEPATIARADRYGITVVAITAPDGAGAGASPGGS